MRVCEASARAEEAESPRSRQCNHLELIVGGKSASHDKAGDVSWSATEDIADRAKERRKDPLFQVSRSARAGPWISEPAHLAEHVGRDGYVDELDGNFEVGGCRSRE